VTPGRRRFRLGEEVEPGEVHRGVLLLRTLEGELEVVEGPHLREPDGFHPVLAAVGLPGVDFPGELGGEIRLVVPALLGCSEVERPCGLGPRAS